MNIKCFVVFRRPLHELKKQVQNERRKISNEFFGSRSAIEPFSKGWNLFKQIKGFIILKRLEQNTTDRHSHRTNRSNKIQKANKKGTE